jgi:hypothetical protein
VDLSPVFQAGPPLAGGFVAVLLGLLFAGRVRAVIVSAGALVMLGALAAAGIYVGLSLACQAWDRNPRATWLALMGLLLLTATTVMFRTSHRHHSDDDDESEDDGGHRVRAPLPPPPFTPNPAPAPAPSGPSLDWGEFDGVRERWERTPVGV